MDYNWGGGGTRFRPFMVTGGEGLVSGCYSTYLEVILF